MRAIFSDCNLFIFDETETEREWGRGRERERENPKQVLCCHKPDAGLELMNCEIMP